MALSKNIEQASGVTPTYWRIRRVDFDIDAGIVWMLVGGYVNASAWQNDKKPVVDLSFTMSLEEGTEYEDVTRTTLYTWLKTQGTFSGAQDAE